MTAKLTTRLRRITPSPLARWMYRRMAEQYIRNLRTSINPDKKTILIINHFFDQDIRALQRANRSYNLVVIDGPRLFRGGKIFFSDEVMRLLAPYTDENEKNRAAFRRESQTIFNILREKCNFELIVTASDIFWWIREFISIGHEHGVKTVVLDKEGTRSPYAMEGETRRIRDYAPFISDHIFVWSERQRRFWNKIGVADGDITVIGQPRSDLFYLPQSNSVDSFFPWPQPLVTLFSYENTAYIPPHRVKGEGLSWSAMKGATQDEFFILSQKFPDYNFVIKTHPQQTDLQALRNLYRRPNLAVIGDAGEANELIRRSELIIAFQTTAVLEAMFLNRRVIYTAWDPHYSQVKADLLPFHDAAGIVIADTFDRFREVCGRFFAGDYADFDFTSEEQVARDRFVNEYFHKPDGKVCERFFTEIGRFFA